MKEFDIPRGKKTVYTLHGNIGEPSSCTLSWQMPLLKITGPSLRKSTYPKPSLKLYITFDQENND